MTDERRKVAEPGDKQDTSSETNPVGIMAIELAEMNERIGYLHDQLGEIPARVIAGINPPTHKSDSKPIGAPPTFGRLALLLVAGVTVAWLASPASPFGHSAATAVVVALALPLVCLGLILGRVISPRE